MTEPLPNLWERARELVRRSCAAQGIPEIIEDPATLARVAALMTSAPSARSITTAASGPVAGTVSSPAEPPPGRPRARIPAAGAGPSPASP